MPTANIENTNFVTRWDQMKKLQRLHLSFPNLFPSKTGRVIHSDSVHSSCGAESLPANDNESGGVNRDSAAIRKPGGWNSRACLPYSAGVYISTYLEFFFLPCRNIQIKFFFAHTVAVCDKKNLTETGFKTFFGTKLSPRPVPGVISVQNYL